MDRIDKLCSYLDKCENFADVACDHGYCTQYMLKNNLCKSAVVSDISASCLSKAEKLLKNYVKDGKVKAICCDGLSQIPENCDLVLIAGIGGAELVEILKAAYIPRSFVFQPMRNVRKVREYLLANGAEISKDEVFESGGKFYYVLKGRRQSEKCRYTPAELEFGKDLKGKSTREYLRAELAKKEQYFNRNLSPASRQKIEKEIELIKGVLGGDA